MPIFSACQPINTWFITARFNILFHSKSTCDWEKQDTQMLKYNAYMHLSLTELIHKKFKNKTLLPIDSYPSTRTLLPQSLFKAYPLSQPLFNAFPFVPILIQSVPFCPNPSLTRTVCTLTFVPVIITALKRWWFRNACKWIFLTF